MSYELRANFMLNIILIGYRCSGKTAVGKSLAKKTGRPFVDTDEMLMKKKRSHRRGDRSKGRVGGLSQNGA